LGRGGAHRQPARHECQSEPCHALRGVHGCLSSTAVCRTICSPPNVHASGSVVGMNLMQHLILSLDPAAILRARGLAPDPWQRELLLARDRQILLNCSRQSGKSTVVAALTLHTALCTPNSLVLLL